MSTSEQTMPAADDGATRRDFLYVATAGAAAVGTAFAIWPFIDQMNPSADVQALASIEQDISAIAVGSGFTIKWRGKPVFIRHRTEAEVEAARAVKLSSLPDPEPDEDRVIDPRYLVMIGVCTHLGCVPSSNAGDYMVNGQGGWFCPCHGSHYDTSGRIRKGPAPTNLAVPPYEFVSDSRIRIG